MIEPDDNLELKEDIEEEEPIGTGSECVIYPIYDKDAPVFGRIAIALMLAELFIEIFPYIYQKIYLYATSATYEGLLKITTLNLAMATFSKPLFVGALVVSLVSILKEERKLLAFLTLGALAVILVVNLSSFM